MIVTGPVSTPAGTLDDGAQVLRVPPPMYYGAAFGAGMVLRGLTIPLSISGRPAVTVIGGCLIAGGASLALAGVAAVVRHRTTIVPHHPVTTLVTTGTYRFSRNPMYTGLAIAYVGGALLAGTWWPMATLPFALIAVRRIVIDPEERYLTRRFASRYADYQARTRRWL